MILTKPKCTMCIMPPNYTNYTHNNYESKKQKSPARLMNISGDLKICNFIL